MLMTSEQVALMKNDEDIRGVFAALFHNLKLNSFKRSELESTQVKQLSQSQAVVSGVATRYREDGSVLEHFGLTHTQRKMEQDWQIIVGVLHDPIA